MAGPIASLNASVAGAVALYEVLRQRRTAGVRVDVNCSETDDLSVGPSPPSEDDGDR
jgi:hypothetical protein